MIKHAKTLRFYARLLRVAAVVVLAYGVWKPADTLIFFSSSVTTPLPSFGFALEIIFNSFVSYVIPSLVLWSIAAGFSVMSRVVVDLDKSRQTAAPTPRPKTDEELYGLPKSSRRARPPRQDIEQPALTSFAPVQPKAKVDPDQPPRQKLEKKPRLEPRLYGTRWQGGKPQRAVRKTVIE